MLIWGRVYILVLPTLDQVRSEVIIQVVMFLIATEIVNHDLFHCYLMGCVGDNHVVTIQVGV